MNNIASTKKEELLGYVCNGLENQPDTCMTRHHQQKGLKVFKKTHDMLTLETYKAAENDKYYYNSFSRCRSRIDEPHRVQLTSAKRN